MTGSVVLCIQRGKEAGSCLRMRMNAEFLMCWKMIG
jgi:hypothetical protein